MGGLRMKKKSKDFAHEIKKGKVKISKTYEVTKEKLRQTTLS